MALCILLCIHSHTSTVVDVLDSNGMARGAKKCKIERAPTEKTETASTEPSNVQVNNGNVLKNLTICCHSIQTSI